MRAVHHVFATREDCSALIDVAYNARDACVHVEYKSSKTATRENRPPDSAQHPGMTAALAREAAAEVSRQLKNEVSVLRLQGSRTRHAREHTLLRASYYSIPRGEYKLLIKARLGGRGAAAAARRPVCGD